MGFDSPVPGARIDASVRAANAQDAEAIPDLIALLDSEDPATRLIAANAIEWIIGRPIEFDHAASWAQRREAIRKLQQAYEAGELVPATITNDAQASVRAESRTGDQRRVGDDG